MAAIQRGVHDFFYIFVRCGKVKISAGGPGNRIPAGFFNYDFLLEKWGISEGISFFAAGQGGVLLMLGRIEIPISRRRPVVGAVVRVAVFNGHYQ